MGKRKVVYLGLLVVVLLAGLLPVSIAFAARAQHSTADVTVKGSNPKTVAGESTLVRNANGISFTIQTTMLEPGNAYSVWIKVFEDNFVDADGNIVPIVVADSGGLAAKDGTGRFAGHLSTGVIGEADGVTIVNRGDGTFDTPLTSEVMLVVRDHGPKIPGQVNDQTHTKNSGCREGEANETPSFTCTSVQSTVHKP